MNAHEKHMLAILREGKERHGFDAVKAEFEAEGTRSDEFLRLLELARRAGLKVALKIGGCEAIRDLIEARQYGVDYIIAPMVETPYALTKFIAAKDKVYPAQERGDVDFLINVETVTTFATISEMGEIARRGGVGLVFGRVDFAGSLGKDRSIVNSQDMAQYVNAVATVAREHDIPLVVGGGVNPDSIPLLAHARSIRLDRFETRKIVFDAATATDGRAHAGMELAIQFELLWLKNKRDYYASIAAEDETRIGMMEARQIASTKRTASAA